VTVPLYPCPLRLPPATTAALRARALVRLGGKRDREIGTKLFLFLQSKPKRDYNTTRRHVTQRAVERTRNGFHHLTEALNSRSAFGGDGEESAR